jgi:tetratricopeptide (TPR) repeat protein
MDKKWPVIGITLILILLIYNFVSSIFKSDQKRFDHNRIYVDYSDYRHTKKKPQKSPFKSTASRRNPNAYKAAREAKEIQRKMFSNVMTATISSYNNYMDKALKDVPSPVEKLPKPKVTQQYKKFVKLAREPVIEYESGLSYFVSGMYDQALVKFQEALQNVDPLDVKHRIDIFGMIAECYMRLNNDRGYIQYKVKQVRMKRKMQRVLEQAFPGKKDLIEKVDWETTQQASKNLLRVRSMASRVNSAEMQKMLKRAELDLEVARKVTY